MKLLVPASLVVLASAALPPGFEDQLFCPDGSCMRAKANPNGMDGARSSLMECVAEDGTASPLVKTWGSKVQSEEDRQLILSMGFHSDECGAQDDLGGFRMQSAPEATAATTDRAGSTPSSMKTCRRRCGVKDRPSGSSIVTDYLVLNSLTGGGSATRGVDPLMLAAAGGGGGFSDILMVQALQNQQAQSSQQQAAQRGRMVGAPAYRPIQQQNQQQQNYQQLNQQQNYQQQNYQQQNYQQQNYQQQQPQAQSYNPFAPPPSPKPVDYASLLMANEFMSSSGGMQRGAGVGGGMMNSMMASQMLGAGGYDDFLQARGMASILAGEEVETGRMAEAMAVSTMMGGNRVGTLEGEEEATEAATEDDAEEEEGEGRRLLQVDIPEGFQAATTSDAATAGDRVVVNADSNVASNYAARPYNTAPNTAPRVMTRPLLRRPLYRPLAPAPTPKPAGFGITDYLLLNALGSRGNGGSATRSGEDDACYCDDDCASKGDCCTDYDDYCDATETKSGGGGGGGLDILTLNALGGNFLNMGNIDPLLAVSMGYSAVEAVALSNANPDQTCNNRCGIGAPRPVFGFSGFSNNNNKDICGCDRLCSIYNNCCADKQRVCGN